MLYLIIKSIIILTILIIWQWLSANGALMLLFHPLKKANFVDSINLRDDKSRKTTPRETEAISRHHKRRQGRKEAADSKDSTKPTEDEFVMAKPRNHKVHSRRQKKRQGRKDEPNPTDDESRKHRQPGRA